MSCPMFKLSNDKEIPAVGLGTYEPSSGNIFEAVKAAIDAGYRHFDCASVYQNEKEVGDAIREKIKDGTVTREDLFITSKCWNNSHSTCRVLEACQKTLTELGLDYVDLYLVHWPFAFKEGDDLNPKDSEGQVLTSDVDYLDTWKGMEECHEKGWAKSIGLSNFNSEQIERILKNAKVKPVMNQVECHPYLAQKKLIEFCKEREIMLTAYCPLGSPGRASAKPDDPVLMEDEKVKKVAENHNKSATQVLIRWQVQRGLCVIPKSTTPDRIKENFQVFDFKLSEEEIEELEKLDRNFRYCAFAEFKHHQHYPFLIEF